MAARQDSAVARQGGRKASLDQIDWGIINIPHSPIGKSYYTTVESKHGLFVYEQ